MKNLTKFLCAIALVIAISCAKDGATGPQGPAGTNGTNGNANVMYSDWVTLPTVWRDSTIDASLMKINHLKADSLTSNNLKLATILAYAKFSSTIFLLPYTSNAGGKVSTMSQYPNVGKFFFTRFTHDNSASIGVSGSLEYRYIIIPGSKHLRLVKPLNQMSYDEVCNLYNIPK